MVLKLVTALNWINNVVLGEPTIMKILSWIHLVNIKKRELNLDAIPRQTEPFQASQIFQPFNHQNTIIAQV